MLWDSSMSAKLAWDYYIKFHNFLSISSFFQLLPIKIFIAMNILLKIYLFFNWRIIALQYWFHFCHTSTWISHSVCMFPPILSHPLLVVTEPWFEFPESYSKFPLAIYLHMVVYMLPCYTLYLSHPLLPLPPRQCP